MNIDKILKDALNIYHYGSFVYGTFQKKISDYDYIVILKDEFFELDKQQYEHENCQYSFYIASTWQRMLNNNEVVAIETFFLNKKYIVKETKVFETNIDIKKIRENFSKTASNSFVKCKKKLTVSESFNPRIAKKSLWHSLRIIDFGIQVITYGEIKNYSNLNYLYDEIVNCDNNDWDYYHKKYKLLYNSLKTTFRQKANIK